MTKAEARKVYREKRMQLSDQERDKLEDLMLIRFQTFATHIPDRILSFAPLEDKHEYDPYLVMNYCRFKNPAVQFYYPVTEGEQMHAGQVNEDQAFTKNKYGIPEPADALIENPQRIDMIFVPLVAMDMSGRRVGYGKGYYDRFLQKCRKDAVTIGFSFFEPVEAISDWKPFDVPLIAGITPMNIFYFKDQDAR